jgi:hypothetical protein
MSGSAKAGTIAERHTCELRVLQSPTVRAPPKRASGESFSPRHRIATVSASLKLIFVFDFDVSHHHGQLPFMDIDSRYPVSHRLPPGGSGERAGDYINLGLGLSPLPQREKQRRTIYSLDHARSGSNLHSASAAPLSFRSRHLPAVLDYCLDRNDFHGVSRAEGPGQLTWKSATRRAPG